MNLRRPYVLIGLAFASLTWANDLGHDRLGEVRLGEFRRDADLIAKFVDSAIVLSKESDPLVRAEHCNSLANLLTKEIETAAGKRQSNHAADLGQMLQAVLVDGVAENLRQAATEDLPPEATRAKDIVRVGEASMKITGDVRKLVDQMQPQEQASMQGVVQAMSKAGEHVRKSSHGMDSKHKNGKKGKKF